MPGRSFAVELTDEQAAILDAAAAGKGMTHEAILIEAIGHDLAMIAAGVDHDELREADPPPGDYPGPFPKPPKRRRSKRGSWEQLGTKDLDDGIPF